MGRKYYSDGYRGIHSRYSAEAPQRYFYLLSRYKRRGEEGEEVKERGEEGDEG
jgi:hypothetical protein